MNAQPASTAERLALVPAAARHRSLAGSVPCLLLGQWVHAAAFPDCRERNQKGVALQRRAQP
jgi:hypothetical protein